METKMEAKFTNPITGEAYNLYDYLVSFVDESTGEIDASRKVLDKRIRKQWALSYFETKRQQITIRKNVSQNSVLETAAKETAGLSASDYEQLSHLRREAVAHVQIFLDDDKLIAEDYARRKVEGENSFEFYLEAAINAAIDRALIDLGFVIYGEYIRSSPVEQEPEKATPIAPTSAPATGSSEFESMESKPVPQKKRGRKAKTPEKTPESGTNSLAGFDALLDEAGVELSVPDLPPDSSAKGTFGPATPVADIMKTMSASQARAYVLNVGKYAGKTLGEAYEATKDRKGHSALLDWYIVNMQGNDNVLVAACHIINK